jgi:2-succinyl-5-enolpyruvyl-6-hydroxy-3-cyclohexene-1-carboxylate synthase
VLTTSGTAVAELLPAMVEAFYQGLPLVALTADRPPHFAASGAPQAIAQQDIFGCYAQAMPPAHLRGPIHVNIALEEPMPGASYTPLPRLERIQCSPPSSADGSQVSEDLDTLFMLGELLPAERLWVQEILLQNPAVPIWADAASGLRPWILKHSLPLICGGDACLAHCRPQQIIRLGGVPSCRFWRDLEQTGIPVHSWSRSGHRGLGRTAHTGILAPLRLPKLSGCRVQIGNITQDCLQAHLGCHRNSEQQMLLSLSTRIASDDGIFIGNSMPIRTWNLLHHGHSAEEHLHVLRGANGIDGNLSLALGALAAYPRAWIILGDLTALYSLAAPWILNQMPPGQRNLVVINNGGGHIFRRLPSLRDLKDAERTLIENPHDIRLEGWAKMWGLDYCRVETSTEFAKLDGMGERSRIIELLPDAEQTEQVWQGWRQASEKLWPGPS